MNFSIQIGVLPEHREEAARLFAQAFRSKFLKILGDTDVVALLFARGLNLQRAITAVSDDEKKLLGIAGFQLAGTTLTDVQFSDFTRQFGLIQGTFKFVVLALLFSRTPDNPKQLLMDGIVVKEGNRGKGIGKALFQKLEEMARERGMETIKLDVIDENPQAKKLYERLGFVAKNHQKVPGFIQKVIGVSGATGMVKVL